MEEVNQSEETMSLKQYYNNEIVVNVCWPEGVVQWLQVPDWATLILFPVHIVCLYFNEQYGGKYEVGVTS